MSGNDILNGGSADFSDVNTDTINPAGTTVTIGGHLEVDNGFNVNSDNLFVDYINERVGVGTATPSVELDVIGDVNISGDASATDMYISGSIDVSDTVNAGSLVLDSSATSVEGAIGWNDILKTINIHSGGDPVLSVGYEFIGLGLNNTGSTISKCKVVYADDYSNGLPIGGLAQADKHETISGTIAVTTESVNDNNSGRFTLMGTINCDTTGMTEGAVLYVDPDTPGDFTTTKPNFPDYNIRIGRVSIGNSVDGQIYISTIDKPIDTLQNFHNGTFREQFDFTVSSNGTIITGTLEPTDTHPDMTMIFSTGFTTLDTSPALTINLTAGSSSVTQKNYIYIPISTKVLTVSTSDFPSAEEYIPIATVDVFDAVTTQTYEAYGNQNYNNFVQNSSTNIGQLSRILRRMRQEPAQHKSGVQTSATIVTASTPDDVYVSTTAGEVYQIGVQTVNALNSQTGDPIWVINHPTTAYTPITNLNTQILDANGDSLHDKSFNFVLWGMNNKSGEPDQLNLNLPIGSERYNDGDKSLLDEKKYSVYDIPVKYKSNGFLIARFVFQYKDDEWVLYATDDLRGKSPSSVAGGSTPGSSTYLGLDDTPITYTSQALKLQQVNSAETDLEFTDSPTIVIGNIADFTMSGDTFESDTGSVNFGNEALRTSGSISIESNSNKIYLGSEGNASIYYDSTDLIIKTQENGSADLIILDGNLGIGTSSPSEKLEVNNTMVFTSEYNAGLSSPYTVDWGNGNNQIITLDTVGSTVNFTNMVGGVSKVLLRVVQDGTGNRTVTTWDTDIKWPGGTAPTLSTGVSAIDIISCYWNGTNYFCTSDLDFQ